MHDAERGHGPETRGSATRSVFLQRAAVAGAAVATGGALAGAGSAMATGGKGAPDRRSLHDRLNRTSHWDINVADLAKARAWYEGTTPMRVVAETSASQDFPSLGITGGRFEGVMLRDPSEDANAPMLHLVEWKTPKPVGVANASHANVGFNRIVTLVADLNVAREKVIAQGTQPILPNSDFIRPPLHPALQPSRYISFTAPDHEGVFNQFAQAGIDKSLLYMNFNTADLDRNLPFFLEVLGLDFSLGIGQPEPGSPNVYGGDGSSTTFDGVFMLARGNTRVNHDYLEWKDSRRFATPYKEPTHRGIIRCSFQVDDIEACYETLRRSRWAKKRRFQLSRPEEWNFGPAFGTHQVIELRDFEGIRFQLIEQPAYPLAKLHPFGFDLFPSPKK